MKKNIGLERLISKEVAIGTFLTIASPDLAETVCDQDLDFVVLDWQHGEWTDGTASAALGRLINTKTAPLVRVRSHDPGLINWVLDMGALGVVVPMVGDALEAQAIVRTAFYPPRGYRSTGGNRLARMAGGDMSSYVAEANDQILVVAMVETKAAIHNVEEIMAVDGIGAVLIGPGDLMIDVKSRGEGEEVHEALVQEVVSASAKTGISAGIVVPNADLARERISQGFRFALIGSERSVVSHAIRSLTEAVRG